jgi:hypothetical protein
VHSPLLGPCTSFCLQALPPASPMSLTPLLVPLRLCLGRPHLRQTTLPPHQCPHSTPPALRTLGTPTRLVTESVSPAPHAATASLSALGASSPTYIPPALRAGSTTSPSAPGASSPAYVPPALRAGVGPPPGFPPLCLERRFTQHYSRRPAPASTPSAALPKGVVDVPPVTSQHTMATQAKSGFRMPVAYHVASLPPMPKTFCCALADHNWRAAMEEEHSALLHNHTWDLVPRPPGANIVTGKWIFKYKFRADGTLERYKARWVLRGFTQRSGIVLMRHSAPSSNLPLCAPCCP